MKMDHDQACDVPAEIAMVGDLTDSEADLTDRLEARDEGFRAMGVSPGR